LRSSIRRGSDKRDVGEPDLADQVSLHKWDSSKERKSDENIYSKCPQNSKKGKREEVMNDRENRKNQK
jgi:hypothetical protein